MSAGEPPLSLGALIEHLTWLGTCDPAALDLPVTYGMDGHLVCGGIIQSPKTGQRYVNLAPIKLDKMGGF